jgi:hypothetical protein
VISCALCFSCVRGGGCIVRTELNNSPPKEIRNRIIGHSINPMCGVKSLATLLLKDRTNYCRVICSSLAVSQSFLLHSSWKSFTALK